MSAGGPPQDDPRARGVANPRVVDLVEPDRDRDEVVLLMLERRPWGSEPGQLEQLEAKLNAYLSYVAARYLARDYPRYAGLGVRLQLECAAEPGPDEQHFLEAARRHCEGEGLRFEWLVRTPEELAER